jgi:trans-2,3-dihydro-3-hydroxyanthranilate isomerase
LPRFVKYDFYTCDVFTRHRFGGNPLAVLPDARGLIDQQMMQIAREFNYSETTFVLPAEAGHTRRLRIFTPAREVPFAGHPNIGTAYVLATAGLLGDIPDETEVVFEEGAGPVPVRIRSDADRGVHCELSAPQPLSIGAEVPIASVAAALTLDVADIHVASHRPVVASVGLPFLLVEVRDLAALGGARIGWNGMRDLHHAGLPPDVLFYTRNTGDDCLRARMFAPLDGVPEDPATGSANAALAAFLAHIDGSADGDFSFRIEQGVEMGRPSTLEAKVWKRDGSVLETRIGGHSVLVSEGVLHIG